VIKLVAASDATAIAAAFFFRVDMNPPKRISDPRSFLY
jgi:hypothetical protein